MLFYLDTPVNLTSHSRPIAPLLQTDIEYRNHLLSLPHQSGIFQEIYPNQHCSTGLPYALRFSHVNHSDFGVSPFQLPFLSNERQMIWDNHDLNYNDQAPVIWLENSPRSPFTSISGNGIISGLVSQVTPQGLETQINPNITPPATPFYNTEESLFPKNAVCQQADHRDFRIHLQPYDLHNKNLSIFDNNTFAEPIHSSLMIPQEANAIQITQNQISSDCFQHLQESEILSRQNPFQRTLTDENEQILLDTTIKPTWTIKNPNHYSQIDEVAETYNESSSAVTESDLTGIVSVEDQQSDLENTILGKKTYYQPIRGRRSVRKKEENPEMGRDVVEHKNENVFPCSSCIPTIAFTRKTDCIRHMRSVHATKKSYKCCGKYKRKDNLMKHLRITHFVSENRMHKECDKRKVRNT
ncbi:hypothetical protein HK096_010140 [Nowakowskiella sp. JEL0078]|nr:hypothetical protein HK096_010140 [Nowakowskiella sp. JEL0078]